MPDPAQPWISTQVLGFFIAMRGYLMERSPVTNEGAMERFWFWVQFALVTLVAWWAGLHSAFRVLLVMQTLDVLTGLLAAAMNEGWRSRIGAAGIKRKAATWILLGALAYLQTEATALFEFPETNGYGVAQLSAGALAFMEFVSITENVARMGVPLPPFLRKLLAETRAKLGYEEDANAKP
jgi:toxin secretion/phage lysis holin